MRNRFFAGAGAGAELSSAAGAPGAFAAGPELLFAAGVPGAPAPVVLSVAGAFPIDYDRNLTAVYRHGEEGQ